MAGRKNERSVNSGVENHLHDEEDMRGTKDTADLRTAEDIIVPSPELVIKPICVTAKDLKREDPNISHKLKLTANHTPEQFEPFLSKNRSWHASECQIVSRAGYDNSALKNQRVENSAVHRVRSGAMMTGPVGGSTLDLGRGVNVSSPHSPPPDLRWVEKDLLTSIALLSNDPNPNPLPDAAASSEETTVCQIDDAELAKEQVSTNPKHLNPNESLSKNNELQLANIDCPASVDNKKPNVGSSYDDDFRDPDIPSEVCFVEKATNRDGRHSNIAASEGLMTPHHRSKRKRKEVLMSPARRGESKDVIRIIFTGISPTGRHKRVSLKGVADMAFFLDIAHFWLIYHSL